MITSIHVHNAFVEDVAVHNLKEYIDIKDYYATFLKKILEFHCVLLWVYFNKLQQPIT